MILLHDPPIFLKNNFDFHVVITQMFINKYSRIVNYRKLNENNS